MLCRWVCLERRLYPYWRKRVHKRVEPVLWMCVLYTRSYVLQVKRCIHHCQMRQCKFKPSSGHHLMCVILPCMGIPKYAQRWYQFRASIQLHKYTGTSLYRAPISGTIQTVCLARLGFINNVFGIKGRSHTMNHRLNHQTHKVSNRCRTKYGKPQPFRIQMTAIEEVTIHLFFTTPVRHCGQCEDCLWGMCPWLAPSKEFITIHSTSLEFCQNTVAWFILQTEMPMNQHQFRPRKDFAKQIHLLTARGGLRLKAKDRPIPGWS